VKSTSYENNRLLQIRQEEQHQHMSQHVLFTLISTLTAYPCFAKENFYELPLLRVWWRC